MNATEPIIICPKCRTEIKFTESLAAPLIDATRRKYEQELAKKDADMAARETSIRDNFAGSTRNASAEMKGLFEVDKAFDTPKPEKLIYRVLELATLPGDWVLDSFAGSGTTSAVAHKMGRKWIMCELGEHCHTHIIPRMQKVIDGKDPGGVTEAVGWKGGGGFRYYRLAPSLLERDAFDQWVINKKYNPNMLAEAICKLEGFTYAPSETAYWQHGRSTESDFIYITTQTLTRDQLQRLSDEVGESRTLLVMCGAFRVKNPAEFQNLTLKKIPNAVLRKCEWGRDDYSLEIKDLPQKPEEEAATQPKPKSRSKAERRDQATLFELPGNKEERKWYAPGRISVIR